MFANFEDFLAILAWKLDRKQELLNKDGQRSVVS